jgi:hypothetical protein
LRANWKAKADPEGFHGARINLAASDMSTMGLTVERGGRNRQCNLLFSDGD